MNLSSKSFTLLLFFLFVSPNLSMRNITISGNATLGYYYVDAYIGTPPQKQALILDTGSNLTIFPCKGCTECRDHINHLFDPKKSKTFEKLKTAKKYIDWKCPFFSQSGSCGFTQGYTEGSMYKGNSSIMSPSSIESRRCHSPKSTSRDVD